MNTTASESSIEIDKVVYQLKSIDEFGFSAAVNLPTGIRAKGLLTLGSDKLEVGFRVRENNDQEAKCSFANLSLAGSDLIQKFLRKKHRGFLEGALESRSYDELAKGITGVAPKTIPPANTPTDVHATDASDTSKNQSAKSIVPKSKTSASQWESTKTIGASSARNSNVVKSTSVSQPATQQKAVAAHQTSVDSPAATSKQTTALDQTATPKQNVASKPTANESTSTPQPDEPQPQTSQAVADVSSLTTSSDSDNLASETKSAKSGVRSLAMLLMMFALIGLSILAVYFLRSRSSLSISHSALVGNHLPVNVKVEGEIVELMVSEGDAVKEGDVLMRLNNPTMQVAKEQLTAQLETAKVKIKTLKKQLKNSEKRVKIAGEKLELDLMVANSEKEAAANFLEVAKINFDRMKPALDSGAVTTQEFEIVRQELLASEANKMATENAVKQIEFAQNSVKDNVLIMGDRFDDENGRLAAELQIAEAEKREAESALSAISEQFANLNVTAPRDGTVYVVYRQVGEFVKMADETVGISFEGKVWAAGQVSESQSRRVRPGQPVTVSAPSLGQKFEGVVSAVGHRAMYSRGFYTADFRGETATDVPVKVVIQDLPDSVPAGIRLEMSINTGFGVGWLDRTMGYSLRSVSDGKPVNEPAEEKTARQDYNVDEAVADKVAADI